ncbi:MAG TPA: 3-phosphoserine/phosphohydroxythreonine transaminase, partial [Rhodocyclaceae bacterium]|nr:3-phosphoserine/phosphohydroxythreonine transaminase [Rhodocyclaceae bacterium]
FSAGPAALPEPVLRQAAEEMLDWHGRGMSIMEMSHRTPDFEGVIAAAEADLRELLNIPKNYKVLFLQGGATLQFSMIPVNLLRGKTSADYIVTGSWSEKAEAEARRFCTVNIAATTEASNFTYAPAQDELKLSKDAAYVHVCTNETIMGVEFPYVPETGDIPLVADMSSHILSREIDVSKYGLIYAGAQKNIGPVGLTIVIVREDLMGQPLPGMPTLLDYKVHADNGSMLNTPPTFAIYMAGLIFKWLKTQGGVAGIEKQNIAKAQLLYKAIDESQGFYRNPVRVSDRSRMNVPFTLIRPELDALFLKESLAAGLSSLKGHKSVGGMRASIYNPMPLAGIEALVGFMRDFAARNA